MSRGLASRSPSVATVMPAVPFPMAVVVTTMATALGAAMAGAWSRAAVPPVTRPTVPAARTPRSGAHAPTGTGTRAL